MVLKSSAWNQRAGRHQVPAVIARDPERAQVEQLHSSSPSSSASTASRMAPQWQDSV